MSKTYRRKAWRLFAKERKPYRKAHQRRYRHTTNSMLRVMATSTTTYVVLPEFRGTSGWLTW